MAGLVPAIHTTDNSLTKLTAGDARNKSGHDCVKHWRGPKVLTQIKQQVNLELAQFFSSANIGEVPMSELNFDELLESDFSWPKIGDKLFLEDSSAHAAFVAKDTSERRYHLKEGYKLAADLLVAQSEVEPWRRKRLIYPIVFCYRHFLELTVKAILEEYGEPSDKHHKLETLWIDFRKLLCRFHLEHTGEEDLSAIEVCIAEFAKIDPLSQTFRYPTSRKGQPLEIDYGGIDLLHLCGTMQAIANFFDCVDTHIHELVNAQPEW